MILDEKKNAKRKNEEKRRRKSVTYIRTLPSLINKQIIRSWSWIGSLRWWYNVHIYLSLKMLTFFKFCFSLSKYIYILYLSIWNTNLKKMKHSKDCVWIEVSSSDKVRGFGFFFFESKKFAFLVARKEEEGIAVDSLLLSHTHCVIYVYALQHLFLMTWHLSLHIIEFGDYF